MSMFSRTPSKSTISFIRVCASRVLISKTIKTKRIGRNLDIFRIAVEEKFRKSIIMGTPRFNKPIYIFSITQFYAKFVPVLL